MTMLARGLNRHWNSNKTVNQNTAWMMAGNLARLVISAGYFIMTARYLGAHEYGTFLAVAAAAAIASPFVANGCSGVMIKNVARDRSQWAESFGTVLVVTLVSGAALSALVVTACLAAFPKGIHPATIAMIVTSDLIAAPYVTAAGAAFWSLERLGWTATLNALISLGRLTGIAAILLLDSPTLTAWSIAYLITSSMSGLIAIGCVLRFIGAPKLNMRRVRGELWEGLQFSVSQSAQTIYNDIDKTMLARLGTMQAVGIYGAAYRIIDVAFLPVASFLSAAYPDFFRNGLAGLDAALRFGRTHLKKTVPYSMLALSALLIGAPLVPKVLGHEYTRSTEALRWLAVLPLLKTLHYFIANSLTGSGHQVARTTVQAGVATFNVVVNLWLIPKYGWRGAAWSSIASDALLVLGLWLLALHLRGRAGAATLVSRPARPVDLTEEASGRNRNPHGAPARQPLAEEQS
jgi:O-antigen/teichoic acid export membrane protein